MVAIGDRERARRGGGRGERRPPRPLDEAALERLALRYVERYATTRGKLINYLRRKLREREWTGERPADPKALADRHVAAGHIDDAGYARAKAGALSRRGYGERRIAATLRAHRLEPEVAEEALAQLPEDGTVAAVRLLKRRRLGPFARPGAVGEDAERRTLGVLLRAGHGFAEARGALSLSQGEAERLLEEASARDGSAAWG